MKLLKKITDKDFGGTDEISCANPSIKARAVLLDENDCMALLCLHKLKWNNYNDLYMIPGGSIEAGESLEKALEREMLEETGCHINIIEEVGYIEENCAKEDYVQITHYYLAKVTGKKGQPQMTEVEIEQQTELQWHSLEKALDIIANQVADGLPSIKLRDKTALSEVIKHLRK